jgi:hypothetical protein
VPASEPLLQTIAISLLTAVVAAVLTAHLALRRFRSERWWEKKFAVHTSIIEALQQMEAAFYEDFKEVERASRRGEEPEPSQLHEKTKAPNEEISRAIGFGEFIISKEAVWELRRLRRELAKQHDSSIEYLIESPTVINDCLAHIRQIGKDDLKRGPAALIRRARRILVRSGRWGASLRARALRAARRRA